MHDSVAESVAGTYTVSVSRTNISFVITIK